MRKWIVCGLLLPALAHAGTMRAVLESIQGEGTEERILRFSDGRIARLSAQQGAQLRRLEANLGALVTLETDDSQRVQYLRRVERAPQTIVPISETDAAPVPFEPTPVTQEGATAIYERLNPKYQRVSQCHNRAHVWAYEEFKEHQVQSHKSFVFFTTPYIRRHNFVWWFHVAPMVQAGGEPLVLDYRYAHGPVSVRQWTDLFVHSGKACAEVQRYSEIDFNSTEVDCYVIHSSMYYWQPWHLKLLDEAGVERQSFSEADIRDAYREAF
jgi:hypothetical protein